MADDILDPIETPEEKLEDIQDPGELEGVSKPTDKEQFQGKIQDRIDELTRNWRGTERDLKAAIEKLTDRDEELEVLMEQNQKLLGIIDGKEKAGPKALDPEDGLNIEIKNVRTKMSDARKKLEWEVYDQLEEKLTDLNNQLINVKVRKIAGSVKPVDGAKALNENAVAEFTSAHPWFDPSHENFDPMMRGAAIEYDDYLLTQKEWKDKPLSVRLKEVKKVIEKRFAGTIKSGPPKVEPSRRREVGNDNDDTKSYGLSETEKRIADKMLPMASAEERYKEYARQKKMG